MTKIIYYQKESFGEYLIRFSEQMLTMMIIGMFFLTIIVVTKGNKEIEDLENALGVNYTLNYYERKSIEEMVSDYIDTLPLPIEQVVEEIEQILLSKVPSNIDVGGITPTITTFNTSAYCACEVCCGKTDGITASGKKATEWYTVAAGQGYKMGTIIYIPELTDMPNGGWFVVQDRGGAITNDRLDVYMSSHEKALQFGRKNLEAYVYEN